MKQAAQNLHTAQLNNVQHGLFMSAVSKGEKRAEMIARLREQVRAGSYSPNLRVVAERMLRTCS